MIPSGYLDVNSLNAVIGYQALEFNFLTVETLPYTSVEGRSTQLIHISHAPGTRRSVFFQAGTHAREVVNPDMLLSFTFQLCNAYRNKTGITLGNKSFSAQDIRMIVQQLDLYILPLVNPDGRNRVFTDSPWWRKNCNPIGTSMGYGVDINRNQTFLWSSLLGSTTNPQDSVYRGPSPTSEAESLNVQWVFQQHPEIWCFADVHSFSQLVIYPWGDAPNQTVDPNMNYANPQYDGQRGEPWDTYKEYMDAGDLDWFQSTASQMRDAIAAVRGNAYTVTPESAVYGYGNGTCGTFLSTAYASPAHVRGITLETGQTFQPEFPEAAGVMQETIAGLLQLCLLCVPNQTCPQISDQILALEDDVRSLQADLQDAPPGAKGRIAAQIRKDTAAIKALRDQAANLGCIPIP